MERASSSVLHDATRSPHSTAAGAVWPRLGDETTCRACGVLHQQSDNTRPNRLNPSFGFGIRLAMLYPHESV